MEHTKAKQGVAIVCGGKIENFEWFKQIIQNYNYIIAADSGYDILNRCGVVPNVIIGDFDSVTANIPSHIPCVTFPVKKDETDFMLALQYCADNGFTDLDVFGALGGRIDHSLGAIFALMEIKKEGNVSANLITQNCKAFIVNDYCEIKKNNGYVSVFALGKDALGVTLNGFEYPLNNAELKCCSSLGVSNKIIDDIGSITVDNGCLLIVIQN